AAMASPGISELIERHPRALVVEAVRAALAVRRERRSGPEDLAEEVAASLRPSLRRAINATGVILHTNLGRAPLAEEAVAAVAVRRSAPPTGPAWATTSARSLP